MASLELFSKRQKKLRGDIPDVYIYDKIPEALRVQIIHIWADAIGEPACVYGHFNNPYHVYKAIVDVLCREYGLFSLATIQLQNTRAYFEQLCKFLLTEQDFEKVLDVVELSFRYIDNVTRDFQFLDRMDASKIADDAIDELNDRFKEHGVGFQFVDDEIIRVDSELLHAKVVKPALGLLRGKEFAGAQAEFLKAHEWYRHGNTKEVLVECLKALESTIKSICDKRKWKYAPNATCSMLIDLCFQNNLIPPFWTQHFSALRSTLESGVPTARNKLGGHGQGVSIVEVPPHLAAYVLHITASAIVFLVEAEKALDFKSGN